LFGWFDASARAPDVAGILRVSSSPPRMRTGFERRKAAGAFLRRVAMSRGVS